MTPMEKVLRESLNKHGEIIEKQNRLLEQHQVHEKASREYVNHLCKLISRTEQVLNLYEQSVGMPFFRIGPFVLCKIKK